MAGCRAIVRAFGASRSDSEFSIVRGIKTIREYCGDLSPFGLRPGVPLWNLGRGIFQIFAPGRISSPLWAGPVSITAADGNPFPKDPVSMAGGSRGYIGFTIRLPFVIRLDRRWAGTAAVPFVVFSQPVLHHRRYEYASHDFSAGERGCLPNSSGTGFSVGSANPMVAILHQRDLFTGSVLVGCEFAHECGGFCIPLGRLRLGGVPKQQGKALHNFAI